MEQRNLLKSLVESALQCVIMYTIEIFTYVSRKNIDIRSVMAYCDIQDVETMYVRMVF